MKYLKLNIKLNDKDTIYLDKDPTSTDVTIPYEKEIVFELEKEIWNSETETETTEMTFEELVYFFKNKADMKDKIEKIQVIIDTRDDKISYLKEKNKKLSKENKTLRDSIEIVKAKK